MVVDLFQPIKFWRPWANHLYRGSFVAWPLFWKAVQPHLSHDHLLPIIARVDELRSDLKPFFKGEIEEPTQNKDMNAIERILVGHDTLREG